MQGRQENFETSRYHHLYFDMRRFEDCFGAHNLKGKETKIFLRWPVLFFNQLRLRETFGANSAVNKLTYFDSENIYANQSSIHMRQRASKD